MGLLRKFGVSMDGSEVAIFVFKLYSPVASNMATSDDEEDEAGLQAAELPAPLKAPAKILFLPEDAINLAGLQDTMPLTWLTRVCIQACLCMSPTACTIPDVV